MAAAWALAAIGASDWLDGALARGLKQESDLGKALDPLADRAAIAAALLGGWVAGVVPGLLAGALVLREGVVLASTIWLAVRRRSRVSVRFLGKTATLLLYVALPAFYLAAAGVATRILEAVGWTSGAVGALLYYAVLVQYAGDLRRAGGYPPRHRGGGR